MKITNQFNLPATILNAVKDDEYDKGDSLLSVTQLITPPRIVLLQDLNADNLTVDVVDRVPALLGTAVHKIIEKGSKDLPNHIVEERLFAEILGWKISGAVDLQIDNGGTWEINDYKVTSVYSVMDEKVEWVQQLNCYAYLAKIAHGREVTKLKIIAILRDWQRKQAGFKADYPAAQVVGVDIPLWTFEEQRSFVEGRVALHQEAKKRFDNQEPITYCTNQERWLRGETWAVMKEGRKSAIALYENSEEDARIHAERLGAGHRVEHRPGSPVRCAGNYCMVANWCRQYQEELGNLPREGAGGMPECRDE